MRLPLIAAHEVSLVGVLAILGRRDDVGTNIATHACDAHPIAAMKQPSARRRRQYADQGRRVIGEFAARGESMRPEFIARAFDDPDQFASQRIDGEGHGARLMTQALGERLHDPARHQTRAMVAGAGRTRAIADRGAEHIAGVGAREGVLARQAGIEMPAADDGRSEGMPAHGVRPGLATKCRWPAIAPYHPASNVTPLSCWR